jgi:hypothetical protein
MNYSKFIVDNTIFRAVGRNSGICVTMEIHRNVYIPIKNRIGCAVDNVVGSCVDHATCRAISDLIEEFTYN